ncbi:MAG: PAS domain-containing protein [Alphaproteobacteria bacterium]|nr:PAS domain-containing protein [Alphaproteobacteria bacterium]
MTLDVDHAALNELYRYWDFKRAGRDMPARADLDPPLDTPHLLPNLMLMDVLGAPRWLRYRLVGSAVDEQRSGLRVRSLTGRHFDEVDFYAERDVVLATYRGVIESRRPHYEKDNFRFDQKRGGRWFWLLLPLSDDARNVAMILAGLFTESPASRSATS